MSILTWIEDKKRLKLLNAPKYVHVSADSSNGLWTRCDKCGVILYIKHLKENQRVCFGCSYHLQMMSQERIENLLDKLPASSSSNSLSAARQKSTPVGLCKSNQSHRSTATSRAVYPVQVGANDDDPQSLKSACKKKNSSRQSDLRVGGFSTKTVEPRPRKSSTETMVSTWRPLDETVSPCDPLKFHDQKRYTDRLKDAQERTGLQDAIQTGTGMIDGIPVALAVMDFSFMGGSMGSVVGEKITRLIEYATAEGLTLLIVSASGGARMQEGVFSLMQMAKISSALQIYQSCAKLLYISILTSPTTGGVTASFAMLGDIIFAEPKALIAFAGRRVIEQTLAEDLPEDFQTSESMLHHGLVDLIVPRRFLRQALSESIRLYQNAPFKKVGLIPFGVQNPITFLTEEKVRRQWSTLTKKGTKQFTTNQLNSAVANGNETNTVPLTDSRFGEQTFQQSKIDRHGSCVHAPRRALFARASETVNPVRSLRDNPNFESVSTTLPIGDLRSTISSEDQEDIKHMVYREILTSFEMMLNLFAYGKGIKSNTTDLRKENKPVFIRSTIDERPFANRVDNRGKERLPLPCSFLPQILCRVLYPKVVEANPLILSPLANLVAHSKSSVQIVCANRMCKFTLHPVQILLAPLAVSPFGKRRFALGIANRLCTSSPSCPCAYVPLWGKEGVRSATKGVRAKKVLGVGCKAQQSKAKHLNGEKPKTIFNQKDSYSDYKSEKSFSGFTKIKRQSENELENNYPFFNGVKKKVYQKLAKELYPNGLQGSSNRGNVFSKRSFLENGSISTNELVEKTKIEKGYNPKMPLSKHIALSLTKKRFVRVLSVAFANTTAFSTSTKPIDSTTSFLTPAANGVEKQAGTFTKRGFVQNTQYLRFASFRGFLNSEEIPFSSASLKQNKKTKTVFPESRFAVQVPFTPSYPSSGKYKQRDLQSKKEISPLVNLVSRKALALTNLVARTNRRFVSALVRARHEASNNFEWKSVYGNVQSKIKLYKKISICKKLTSQVKRIEQNRIVPIEPFTLDSSKAPFLNCMSKSTLHPKKYSFAKTPSVKGRARAVQILDLQGAKRCAKVLRSKALRIKDLHWVKSNAQGGGKKGFVTQSSFARKVDTTLRKKKSACSVSQAHHSVFPVWPRDEVDRFDLLHNFRLASEDFVVNGFDSPSQENNSNRFSQTLTGGTPSKMVDYTSGNADINFLNQAIELAATDSVEWRAFYIHQQLSENMGFLEDFLQQDHNSRKKNGNLLFYKSICRSQKALNE